MTNEQWTTLQPYVNACKKSSDQLYDFEHIPVLENDRERLGHWIGLRKLERAHEADVAAMDNKLIELGLL
jgi:hypothetical protein